jgi:bifunctional N-acetylglucosamine-1-phosphate-uridyltransferase/glucosamine-1-phosphate-acetyltransferase GlmU-like protein
MLDWILELYRPYVSSVVVVVSPASRDAVARHLLHAGVEATVLVQESPTGMLDAILLAVPVAASVAASHVWVTWCDQVGVHPRTVRRLADLGDTRPSAALVMPTCERPQPYIHLLRGADGRIERILQRREGDHMPAVGESDMGLFSLSGRVFAQALPAWASQAGDVGEGTGERNFLPFIAAAEREGGVVTYPCVDPEESVGVNTPEELALIERYLSVRRVD